MSAIRHYFFHHNYRNDQAIGRKAQSASQNWLQRYQGVLCTTDPESRSRH